MFRFSMEGRVVGTFVRSVGRRIVGLRVKVVL